MEISIYKITNIINNKVYIGQTKNDIKLRFKGHVKDSKKDKYSHLPLYRAFNKYGLNNFKLELIGKVSNLEEAIKEEFNNIISHGSYKRELGYNLTLETNQGRVFNESSIERMRAKRIEFYSSLSTEKKEQIKDKLSKHFQGKSSGKSGFIGVYKTKDNTWRAIVIKSKNKYRKTFKNQLDAIEFYDKMALYLYGEKAVINLEEKREDYLKSDLKEYFSFMSMPVKKSSKYRGISWNKERSLWQATVIRNKKKIWMKRFKQEDDAFAARNDIISKL